LIYFITVMSAIFKDPVHPENSRSLLSTIGRLVLFNTIALIALPLLFPFLMLFKFKPSWKLMSHIFHGAFAQPSDCKDEVVMSKLWAQPSAQAYLTSNALEYQRREGFCCRTTQRCVLKSIPSVGAHEIPPVCGGPASADAYSTGLDAAVPGKVRSSVVAGEEGYSAFMSALKKVNNPGKYRVSVNFLRPALFGPPAPRLLPSSLLLALFGGHHSPVMGYLEQEDVVGVFDVNHRYGILLLSSRQLFEAVDTFDILSGAKRAIIITEISPTPTIPPTTATAAAQK
jgi:hypothetical protein